MVKVIWHKTASPPQMDGSIVFARWRQCAQMGGYIGATWRIRLNLCFLQPTRVHNPNGISIGSAVFAQLTADTLQWAPLSEQGMGRWVMGHGSNGSRKWDGSHGSWVTGCWPMTHQFFKTLWLGLYIVAMIIYRVSVWCICNCACDWRSSKFTFTFKFMLVGLLRVPG